MSRLINIGYALCFRGDLISNLWSRIWFRWYCPYPVIEDQSAHACISGGHCGCDNKPAANFAASLRRSA